MSRSSPMTRLSALLVTLLALSLGALPATAQSLFAPAFQINDQVATNYMVQQRARMLAAFNAPGNPETEGRKQLMDDMLRLEAAKRFGLAPTEEEIAAGRAEFAGRANLTTEEFLAALQRAGVDQSTFDLFIRAGIVWREIVRGRFANRVNITESEIDRAMTGRTGGGSVRVLISEIVIPAPPQNAAEAQALASRLSQIRSIDEFAAAARQYSAVPSGRQGGRVNWMPVTNLPPALQGVVLGLAPGEVSQPLPVTNAIVLLQLRALEEGEFTAFPVTEVEYAAYYIPGGRTEAGLAEAARVRAQVDTCNDLYGIAQGQPPSVLDRGWKKPGEIPQDVALELAKLDKHEVSTALTRANGQTLVFLMLCNRRTEIESEVSREDMLARLQNQRLEAYSNTYLEQLRADARIVEY